MKLRKLNQAGLKAFHEFLKEARSPGSRRPNVPEMLLSLPVTSEEIPGAPDLEQMPSTVNGYVLARYLIEQFEKTGIDASVIEGANGLGDPGFWAAVGLFYFNTLTPEYRKAGKPPKADNCYIPETDTAESNMRYFRHRIAGAYRLVKLHGDACEPLLLSPVGIQSGLYAAITDSVFYNENRCIVEAVKILYFDPRKRELRQRWNAKDAPGTFPRLLAVMDQLDLNYDLLGVSGEALICQLPKEFKSWLPPERS